MKKIFFVTAIVLVTIVLACSKKLGEKRSPNTNSGNICYSDQSHDVPLFDSLHTPVDTVQVVYNVIADLKSSLSDGSKIDSVYYTGVVADSKGIKDSIVEIGVGPQPDYQNWATGFLISGQAFNKLGSRTLHLRVKFSLYSSNAVGRGELQVTYIHNAGFGKPAYDNWDDNCKKR
jgi:hypothetical protein